MDGTEAPTSSILSASTLLPMSLWQVVCVSNQFKPPGSSTNLRQPRPTAVSSIQPSGQSIGACVVVVLELSVGCVAFVGIVVTKVVELPAGLGSRCLGVAVVGVGEVEEVVAVVVGVVVVLVVVGGGGCVVVVVNVVRLQARANGRRRRKSCMLSLQFYKNFARCFQFWYFP